MSTATTQATVSPQDRVYGRLKQFSTTAILPWMLVSFVSIMAFGTPNAIVTPLMRGILICVWCYPAILLMGRFVAWVLRVYGQYDRANLALSFPSSMGAFLFALLIVPLVVMPFFRDGYFGWMASCLLSIIVASWTMKRLRRV